MLTRQCRTIGMPTSVRYLYVVQRGESEKNFVELTALSWPMDLYGMAKGGEVKVPITKKDIATGWQGNALAKCL